MALEKANQPIRWLQRIGSKLWNSMVVVFAREVLGAFLNIRKEDGVLKRGARTADTTGRLTLYVAADYGLWFLSAGIFTTMKLLGFTLLWIFAALWAYDFIVAGAFVLFYEKTGKDLSLGEDFRRATDTIYNKSRLAAYMAMAPIVIRGIFWNGPEKIITFFRKEIGTVPWVVGLLLLLTAVQAFIWAVLYELGYGLVTG